MKNAFYFMLKALFVLGIFTFLPWLFSYVKRPSLIRKLKFISKFITSQTEQQIITIHLLPNISRSKSNHAMKFGQLTEYNMGNIFRENSSAKYSGEASSKGFYK